MTKNGLKSAYSLSSVEEATTFYDGWAADYDDELKAGGYITPQRCAEALAAHATLPWAPLADFGCGTGMSGLALRTAGFECLDGFDISAGMLARAQASGIYRATATLDLAQPFGAIADGAYQNAAAIGVLSPAFMPTTVIDEMLRVLPCGGCLVLSLNDHAAADGTMETRLLELTEHAIADLMFKQHGEHIPGIGLQSTVYVLKKR